MPLVAFATPYVTAIDFDPVVPGVAFAFAKVAFTSVLVPETVTLVVPDPDTLADPLAVTVSGVPAGEVMVTATFSPFTYEPDGTKEDPRPRFEAVEIVAVFALVELNATL